jgi:2-oxoglutarate ferredoxin oxidoreductase subunit alpha
MTGNQVVGTAALAAGVQYCSMYPMTPTSEILHFLAAQQHRFPLVVKHVEDEIAAINQAIGASYMGARAMTASATGGYALMVEGTSLAGIAETPLVIVVGQRPGPATGLPTWTCQSDLQFVLNAGHGEIPRVVLTPGSPEEHYTLTKLAFELAERFHLVVFVLSDKFALESYASMTTPEPKTQNERFGFVSETLPADNSYRRFVDTSEGWSPRSVPGQAHGLSITNSYEHDAFGYATEDAVIAKQMNQKRLRKLATVAPLVPKPVVIGAATATTTLVCWGSTRLVVEEVIRRGALQQHSINAIHFPCIWPFPKEEFLSAVAGAKRVVVVEGNQTGQLEQLIRQETGIVADRHIRRFDGRPFFAEEVLQEIQQG